MRFGDVLGLGAHAAGDDDLAVLVQRLPDGIERLRLGGIEKTAGVDDDQIRALVLARQLIALGAQPRDDAFGIDQRLGAAERDEAHLGRGRAVGIRGGFCGGVEHAGGR